MRRTEMRRTEMRRTDRERSREIERERGGPHAVQLPQGKTHTTTLLSPWRGRGRHSFLFRGKVLPKSNLSLICALSKHFEAYLKSERAGQIARLTFWQIMLELHQVYFVPLSNRSEGVASAFFFSRVRWDRGRVGSNISVVVSGSFGGTDFSKWDVSVSILCSALWFLVSTLPGFEPGIAGCHRHTCM